MSLEFSREETDQLKESYLKEDKWVQELFDRFKSANWHLPNEMTAMREILYEKTGVKVIKKGTAKITSATFDPNGGFVERNEYGGTPDEAFDWSYYEENKENK